MTNLWLDILQLAIHTPSPHNTQPWKFKIVNDHEAQLFIERKRMLPKEDLTGSFILLGMAMMVESIALLAANRKHRLDIKWIYREQDLPLIPFAELTLVSDNSIRGEYEDSLFVGRRTSRLNYEKKAISSEAFKSLEKLVLDLGQKLGRVEEKEIIEAILRWNIEALFHDLNDVNYHGEIREYFRCSDKETRELRDGLDYRCMNLSRGELWICKNASWVFLLPIARQLMIWLYRWRLGNVGCIGWLSGPFWEKEQAFHAGKILMRFWLETFRQGIYFHPLGNLVTNQEAFQKISGELKDDKIWLIFKMGYSKQPPPSVRLLLQEILV